MRAAVYDHNGGPEVLRYDEVPDPVLRKGGVIVEVGAVSIQGGDVLNRQGGALVTHPHIVGYQVAGVIREVGSEVIGFVVGQKVAATMAFGSHAELVSVSAASVFAIPDSMSIETAAGIPIEFGTAHDCLFEFGRLVAGETVLIQAGAGGVGLSAIQLAKKAGAALVLATASSDERLDRLHAYGMDHGINYAIADVASEVRRLTDGKGVNLVVDPVGGKTLEGSVGAVAYRGRISWVGNAGRADEAPAIGAIMGKNASITGVFLGAEMAMNAARTRPMIETIIDRVASGELEVVVDRVVPLEEAGEAHRYIESRKAFGRVMLRP